MGERISNFTHPIVWYPSCPPSECRKDSDSRKTALSSLRAKVSKTINESQELIKRIENQQRAAESRRKEIENQHREIEAQHDEIRKQHQEIADQHIDLRKGQKELWKKIETLEEKINSREMYTPPLQIQESNPNISEKKTYQKKDNKIYNVSSSEPKKEKINSFFKLMAALKKLLRNFIMLGVCSYESDSLLSSVDGDAD